MFISPHVSGGQNSETYWVGGRNISPIMRANSIHFRRANEFHSAYIIGKNFTEVLPDKNKLSLDKPNIKITLTSWITWIRSYTENNRMGTIFRVYDPYLKTEVYLLDDWGASKYGKISKWVQALTTTGMEMEITPCLQL